MTMRYKDARPHARLWTTKVLLHALVSKGGRSDLGKNKTNEYLYIEKLYVKVHKLPIKLRYFYKVPSNKKLLLLAFSL